MRGLVAPGQLHIEVHQTGEISVVRLEGSFVEPVAADEPAVVDPPAGPGQTVVVDASLLGEVDEWGVAWLTRLRDRAHRLGGKLLVYGASGQVAEAVDGASLRP